MSVKYADEDEAMADANKVESERIVVDLIMIRSGLFRFGDGMR